MTTKQFLVRQNNQRGDFERSMTYSKSDQPKLETITTFEDPQTRQYNIFHDKRGNLVDDGRKVFEYDALNRLTGVWQSMGGGQQGSTYTYGTKGHPIAAYTYDGYGHRLTARYNSNNNTILDDDPVDVYAYDRLWRIRTVTRATPSDSTPSATWTYYVREKWYYHDTESGQEMMTGPASTDAPIMRLVDTNGNGTFTDPTDIEQHFVNDHQGSTILVTGKATLDPNNGNLVARGPIIAHVKYDQYGTPKFVHPADVNSDGVVDALDTQHWLNAWREYRTHNTTSEPPSEIWKGTVDADESGVVDESSDGVDPTLPSSTNTDWLAFQASYTAALTAPPLDQQLGNLPLYAGYWWDDAIGLYHVRHRVYRPEWGRWLQRDPLGYAPGWNLYQYVNGMPWGAVDPMGLWSVEELVYTYIFWHVESVKQAVNILDALVHPIRTGEALGDRAVQVEDNAAHAQGRTPTESDYVLSLLGELTGANQFSGGVHGVNVAEERLTSGWERFEDITVGGAQIVSAASSTSASLLRFSQSFAANSVQKVATRSPKSASTRNQPDCTPPAAAENSVVPTTPMVDRIRKVAQQGYDYAVPHPRRQGLNRMELGKDAEVQATRWTRRWAERSGVSLESDGLRFQVRGANSIPDIVFSPARKIFDFKLTPAAVRSSQTRNFRVDFPGHDIEYIFGP